MQILNVLRRHSIGDWGEFAAEGKKDNDKAVLYGKRILSSYKTSTDKVWIMTEAARGATAVLFSNEY